MSTRQELDQAITHLFDYLRQLETKNPLAHEFAAEAVRWYEDFIRYAQDDDASEMSQLAWAICKDRCDAVGARMAQALAADLPVFEPGGMVALAGADTAIGRARQEQR